MTDTLSTEQCMLNEIYANPDDDTVRLVYADYLEEIGNTARAEFIRLQIRLAIVDDELVYGDGVEHVSLVKEKNKLVSRIYAIQIANISLWDRNTHPKDRLDISIEYHRGFIENLHISTLNSSLNLNIIPTIRRVYVEGMMPAISELLIKSRCYYWHYSDYENPPRNFDTIPKSLHKVVKSIPARKPVLRRDVDTHAMQAHESNIVQGYFYTQKDAIDTLAFATCEWLKSRI